MKPAKDWFSAIKEKAEKGDAELDLGDIGPGDRLRVVTAHTQYEFVFLEGRDAELATGRPDRPSGRVRIMGCTFGQSATIKPDQLFCGGHLEFTYQQGAKTYLTSAIREIRCMRARSD